MQVASLAALNCSWCSYSWYHCTPWDGEPLSSALYYALVQHLSSKFWILQKWITQPWKQLTLRFYGLFCVTFIIFFCIVWSVPFMICFFFFFFWIDLCIFEIPTRNVCGSEHPHVVSSDSFRRNTCASPCRRVPICGPVGARTFLVFRVMTYLLGLCFRCHGGTRREGWQ